MDRGDGEDSGTFYEDLTSTAYENDVFDTDKCS